MRRIKTIVFPEKTGLAFIQGHRLAPACAAILPALAARVRRQVGFSRPLAFLFIRRGSGLQQKQSGRIGFIDEWRGVAIILMVLYHAGYDLAVIFGVSMPFFFSTPMRLLQQGIGASFFFLSGCSCRFSHSNLRRGLRTLFFALVMTAVTWLVLPEQRILFGVLHGLSCSMLLFALFGRFFDRLPPYLGISFSLLLFFLCYSVPEGFFGGALFSLPLPQGLYACRFLFPLGFPSPQFYSSDYYPLLPWFFLFLCGAYAGGCLKGGNLPGWCYLVRLRPLAFIGRHTMPIYLLHQPLIFGGLSLLFALLR